MSHPHDRTTAHELESRLQAFNIESMLGSGDALLIVPPITGLKAPWLGVHLLQARAREAGFRVEMLHANLLFYGVIGEKLEAAVMAYTSGYKHFQLLGELLFRHAAYGEPIDDLITQDVIDYYGPNLGNLTWSDLKDTMAWICDWMDCVAEIIARCEFKVVGCTFIYQQANAIVALFSRIKRLRPDIITVVGGSSCAGELAEGVASLSPDIDYVFADESEETFPHFLSLVREGKRPDTRVIQGSPYMDLDSNPVPDYTSHYEQRRLFMPDSPTDYRWIQAETSRGCWWGEKRSCSFCALNHLPCVYRRKSPDRAIEELKELCSRHGTSQVVMMDNIMPREYIKEMLPRLSEELPDLRLYYQIKPTMSLEEIRILRDTGVFSIIQPGIEALSTRLLNRMHKGVKAAHNVTLLRYAGSAGLRIHWNLLYGLPGDERREYEETAELVPLLSHLMPPRNFNDIKLCRFSQYYRYPENYGLSNVRPERYYSLVFPDHADIGKLANYFTADYRSYSLEHPEFIAQLNGMIAAWRLSWNETPPVLNLRHAYRDTYILRDTRGLPGTQETQLLSRELLPDLLNIRPVSEAADMDWAIERKLAVFMDDLYVPLITADLEILAEFERGRHA